MQKGKLSLQRYLCFITVLSVLSVIPQQSRPDSLCGDVGCQLMLDFGSGGQISSTAGFKILFGEGAGLDFGHQGEVAAENDKVAANAAVEAANKLALRRTKQGDSLQLGAGQSLAFGIGGYLELGRGGNLYYPEASHVVVQGANAASIESWSEVVTSDLKADTISLTVTDVVEHRHDTSGIIPGVQFSIRDGGSLAISAASLRVGRIVSATKVQLYAPNVKTDAEDASAPETVSENVASPEPEKEFMSVVPEKPAPESASTVNLPLTNGPPSDQRLEVGVFHHWQWIVFITVLVVAVLSFILGKRFK